MDGISKAVELLGKEDEQHQQQQQHPTKTLANVIDTQQQQYLENPTTTLANVIDTQHQQYLENYFSFGNENDAKILVMKYLNVDATKLNEWKTFNDSSPGRFSFKATMNTIKVMFAATKSWWPEYNHGRTRIHCGKYLRMAMKFSEWAKTHNEPSIKQHAVTYYLPCSGPTRSKCLIFVTREIALTYVRHIVSDQKCSNTASTHDSVIKMIRHLMLKQQKELLLYFVGSHQAKMAVMDPPSFRCKFILNYLIILIRDKQ